MEGKVCVITGATSGLGLETAERLAKLGAQLVLVGRDRARGDAALKRVRDAAPNVAAKIYYADLSRLSEMKRVGAEIAAAEPRIDVLINNAGAMFTTRHTTADGLELTFALNHLSYFVVTNLLLPNLRAAAPSRVVSTASAAHLRASLDFDDLQSVRGYSAMGVYGKSKLANILFTRELARRLAGSEVTANCLHPGFVATRFGSGNGVIARIGMKIAMLGAITVQQGAETIVYLASSPEVAHESGGYFAKSKPAKPSAAARDDRAARQLWDASAKIADIGT